MGESVDLSELAGCREHISIMHIIKGHGDQKLGLQSAGGAEALYTSLVLEIGDS